MKSKLALLLFAAVGSAALAASAQTQSSSGDGASPKVFPTPYITTTKPFATSYVPVQYQKASFVAVQDQEADASVRTANNTPAVADTGQQETRSVTVRSKNPIGRGTSYSTSTVYGTPTWFTRMNLSGEEASIGHEADELARQLAEAKSDSDRDKLKAKLGEVLVKQFEHRQKRHESEIAELEAQVKKLKDLVSKRQENRREIIARRLEQVLRESQGLGW